MRDDYRPPDTLGTLHATRRRTPPRSLVAPRCYNTRDAAAYVGLPLPTFKQQVYAGVIPYVKLTRRLSFDVRDLDRWIDSRKDQHIG